MSRTIIVVGVVAVGLVIGAVGVLGFTNQGGDETATLNKTATPDTTPVSTEIETATTPEKTTETPINQSKSISNNPSKSDNNQSSTSPSPKYQRMLTDILRSNSTRMKDLRTPYSTESLNLSTRILQVKSVSTDTYDDEGNTRLRVDIYDTTDRIDGANELRALMLVYAHVINVSSENHEAVSYDEVVSYSWPNKSASHPTANSLITDSNVKSYVDGLTSWIGLQRTVIKSVSLYQNGTFNEGLDTYENRLERESTENTTIHRVEKFGRNVYVDYSTPIEPSNSEWRQVAAWQLANVTGTAINSGEIPNDVQNVAFEERYERDNGTQDIRTWQFLQTEKLSQVATGEMSVAETLEWFEERLTYEQDSLGK